MTTNADDSPPNGKPEEKPGAGGSTARPRIPLPPGRVAPAHRRRGRLRFLVVVLLIAGGSLYAWKIWAPGSSVWVQTIVGKTGFGKSDSGKSGEVAQPQGDDAAPAGSEKSGDEIKRPQATSRERALELAYGDLEKRFAELEDNAAATAEKTVLLSQGVQALMGEVQGLHKDRAGEKGAREPAPLQSAVKELQDRVAALDAALRQRGGERGGLAATPPGRVEGALAVGQLAQGVRAGHPFGFELALATRVFGADADAMAQLGALAPFAERGVPSDQELRDHLFDLAQTAAEPGLSDSENIDEGEEAAAEDQTSGWTKRLWDRSWDRIRHFFASLVTVRRVGSEQAQAPGDTPLARATALLDAGDLDTAMAEIRSLPEEQRAGAADWLANASKRQAAEKALMELENLALKRLAESR